MNPVVFEFAFDSDTAMRSLKALSNNHAVQIGGKLYWPISAEYDKRSDIIVFRMNIDHTQMLQ
mgnify:CR=1 FL=1